MPRRTLAIMPEMRNDDRHDGRQSVDDGGDATGEIGLGEGKECKGNGVGEYAQQAKLDPEHGVPRDGFAKGEDGRPAPESTDRDTQAGNPHGAEFANQDRIENKGKSPDRAEEDDP